MRLGPSPATVFVGREAELAKLRAALDKAALVTLWGAARRGKPLSDSEALQLFIARAAAVRGEYKPEGAELSAVRDVVQQLEGIPLAIELAASRMGILTATALRDRLKDKLTVLASQGRYATA